MANTWTDDEIREAMRGALKMLINHTARRTGLPHQKIKGLALKELLNLPQSVGSDHFNEKDLHRRG